MSIASAVTAGLIVLAVLCSAFGTETTLIVLTNLGIVLGGVFALAVIVWAAISGK